MMDNVLEYLDRKEVRQRILEVYTEGHDENWQKNATPDWIARDMVGLVKDSPELVYVVLFNHEFLEELVFERGIAKERIIFMADCADEGVLATGVYGVRTMVLPQEIRDPKKAIEFVAEKLCKVLYEGGPMPKTNNLVVFGNPPYQKDNKKEGGGTTHASPIYHLFVEHIIDYLNPRFFSFIIPSRWMNGGRGLDSHRKRMMVDKRLRVIQHFAGSSTVFKEVEIKGGVNYFLWDREHRGKCLFNGKHRHLDEYMDHDIILVDGEASSILDKVLDLHRGKDYLDKTCLPQTPFGLVSSWSTWCQDSDVGAIRCLSKGSAFRWVNTGYTDPSGVLSKYKVVVSEANNGATNEDSEGRRKVIGGAMVLVPQEICTQSYMVLKCFDTETEAKNFAVYAGTFFFRFLLGLHMPGQHVNSDKLGWVPDLGSYTVAPTDEELFKMFGLTEEEIKYINSRIK